MFDRLKLIFTPSPPPAGALEKWRDVVAACNDWGKKRRRLIRVWDRMKRDVTEAELETHKERLLSLAIDAGAVARKSLVDFDKVYLPDIRTDGSHTGPKPGTNPLRPTVYVSAAVMDALDVVYIKHFRNEEPPLDHAYYFMTLEAVSKGISDRFQQYVEEVEKVLQDLARDVEADEQLAGTIGHRSIHLTWAADKVQPLLSLVYGRPSLPLPTRSMLDDFRPLLNIGGGVLNEVSGSITKQEQLPDSSQVGLWYDGLGKHITKGVRGHASGAHTWSEVISLKLKSLSPSNGEKGLSDFNLWVRLTVLCKDRYLRRGMVLQVFQTIMQYAQPSKRLALEQSSSGSMSAGSRRRTFTAAKSQTKDFQKDLHARIKAAGSLSKVQSPKNDLKWALVKNTGYDVGRGKQGAFSNIAVAAVEETAQAVLDSRQKLLQMKGWSTLRTVLYLATNEWLTWNGGGLDKKKFEYWDQIPEQQLNELSWYGEEKQEKIHRLYTNDLDQLAKLGKYLTTYPLLCNNPAESADKRVIDMRMHTAIKNLLDVGEQSSWFAKADVLSRLLGIGRIVKGS
jgi:hypothetical protein